MLVSEMLFAVKKAWKKVAAWDEAWLVSAMFGKRGVLLLLGDAWEMGRVDRAAMMASKVCSVMARMVLCEEDGEGKLLRGLEPVYRL